MNKEMFDPREAQATAYALGEMSAEESAAFEKLLAEDTEALEEIGGVREMAALLQEGFGKELDAMFHPEGLAEPAPTFSVVEFAEEEAEAEESKVVPMDPFGKFSKSRAAVVAMAAAVVAAVAVVPMLREQSGTQMNLAGAASVPVASMEMDTALISSEPLDEVVWRDPAAVRETLRLAVPGVEGVAGGSAQVESPVGFHLAGAGGGAEARSLSYIDPEILRMKSSIEAARRRIEMAESLLKMAETSSEAAAVLRELVSGDGFGDVEALKAESIYRNLLMVNQREESSKQDPNELGGTVFRYGLRDEAIDSGGGFDLGPVWWQSTTPGGDTGAE